MGGFTMTIQVVDSFRGPYRFLSNFWPCPISYDGFVFPSVEHAYQAAKGRPDMYGCFLKITAGQAKRFYRGYARPGWEQDKIPTMRLLLERKFAPGTAEAAMLLSTGDALLIEGNTWGDRFWGVCDGAGDNHLGGLLMERRALLRKDTL